MNVLDELKNRKKIFFFGKVDYWGRGRRVNEVDITVEIRAENIYTPEEGWHQTGKHDISFIGGIWNGTKADYISCGQCDRTLERFDVKESPELFKELLDLWKHYHLKHIEDVPEEIQIRLLNVMNNN